MDKPAFGQAPEEISVDGGRFHVKFISLQNRQSRFGYPGV